MLLKFPQPHARGEQDTAYPAIECEVYEPRTGKVYLVPACCFHDLMSERDEELAGMGLAIVGNVCKLLREAEVSVPPRQFEVKLWLRMFKGQRDADRLPLPWPGMLTDDPAFPLTPEDLPFDEAMFMDEDKEFKKRVDRLALLRRIQETWLPYLKAQVARAA